MSPKPLQAAGASWDYELEFEPTDRRQLVALDVPLSAPANAHFWSDRALRVERPLDSVTRWRMRSAPVSTFETDLPRTLRLEALQLPEGFNPRTVAAGAAMAAGRGRGRSRDRQSRVVMDPARVRLHARSAIERARCGGPVPVSATRRATANSSVRRSWC
jgi:hypothetical protein